MDVVASTFALVLALILGAIGWLAAQAETKRSGRPWGMRPLAWAVIFAASFVVGAVLLAIATRKDRPAERLITSRGGFRPVWFLRTAGTAILGPLGLLATVIGGIDAVTGPNRGADLAVALVGMGLLGSAFLLLTRVGPAKTTSPAPS
jgi:hypothetical protein